jgi:hypothetical protein
MYYHFKKDRMQDKKKQKIIIMKIKNNNKKLHKEILIKVKIFHK